jgi:hypothetical protein
MYYTASSVKKALLANNNLSFDGLDDLGCPQKPIRTWVGGINVVCCGDPKQCSYAQNSICEQRINIIRNGILYAHLIFCFTISKIDNDGFIDMEDSMLGRLIDKNLINTAMLHVISK